MFLSLLLVELHNLLLESEAGVLGGIMLLADYITILIMGCKDAYTKEPCRSALHEHKKAVPGEYGTYSKRTREALDH